MSANNNREGTYLSTPVRSMRAFDALPPEVRQTIANGVDSYAPQPIRTMLRRGLSPELVIALVRRQDGLTLSKRERQRAAAKGPYAGNLPDKGGAP